jgi:prepilin-type N-terminal cleavage/methylation domain-containing protein
LRPLPQGEGLRAKAFILAEQAQPASKTFGSTRFAFTLAEVLITLTVIGVVAALTMPALMANWQEKAYSTANEVFQNRIQQATRIMNVNEKLSGYSSTEGFVDELVNHLKVMKVCKTNPHECFAPKVTNGSGTETVETNKLKTAKDFDRKDYNTNIVGVILNNGYTVMLAYDPDCPVMDIGAMPTETLSCISMVYDINSKSKPNKMTKDVYGQGANIFNTCDGIKVGSLCVASADTAYLPINTCDSNSEDAQYDRECSSGCSSCASNYMAGAKKACAAIGMRLPANWTEIDLVYTNRTELGFVTNAGLYWISYTDPRYSGGGYAGIYCLGSGDDCGSGGHGGAVQKTRTGIDARCVK